MNTKQLIEQFLSYVYCYAGSGMLINTFDDDVAIQNAKACAAILCKEVIKTAKDPETAEKYSKMLTEIPEFKYEFI